MLALDSNDRHLITKFYDLQPNKKQIHLAKIIWQKIADELQTKEYDEDQRASLISTCSKTITQYKFDLMSLNLDIIENIKRGHQQQLLLLQDKLIQSNCNETLKQAIINRQEAMRARHEIRRRRRSNIFIYKTTTASSSFIEVDLKLTPAQMSMFINGFKYIIPCQNSLKGHRIPIADERAKQAFTALQRIFYEFQSQKLSKRLEKRAQREYKIVRTEEYMLKTEAYKEITNGRCPLADNLHSVNTLLDYLSGTSLRRIVVSMHAPATLASKFLNDLLVTIYLKVARKYTFINDIDVIRRLEKHVADGCITSTTKFITTDVENLYTMIPRVDALEAYFDIGSALASRHGSTH
ncbi:unnamed protein product [Rotaria sordida]|uniref:Uncharacterized protein n=1 Tax=Rotaria sordida TaxID=392033 RepID=A0A815LSZ5_9BILA|nr:unnamed protein product [Rotaria sordida]